MTNDQLTRQWLARVKQEWAAGSPRWTRPDRPGWELGDVYPLPVRHLAQPCPAGPARAVLRADRSGGAPGG